jgi:RNA polymerase sigma factor (sigma-70 family)
VKEKQRPEGDEVSPCEPEDGELLRQLEIASLAVAAACRRHGLSGDEAAEFESFVRLRLLENDRRILAKFQGRSRLATYLTTVVQRLFLDFRDAQWGKWRASRTALRLGPTAVLLERLLVRDGLSFDDAVASILGRGIRATRAELGALGDRLPRRAGSRSPLPPIPDGPRSVSASPEDALRRSEEAAHAHRIAATLCALLRDLPPIDRLALKLRYEDGVSVAAIACFLGEKPKSLHRRFTRLLARLRSGLVATGVARDDLPGLFDLFEADLPIFGSEPTGENLPLRPSNSLRGESE